MDKSIVAMLFAEQERSFSNEEIALFKRYIEENVVHTDNTFEFFEENLSYYAFRHTSEYYFSPAEYFHANANLTKTDELMKNIMLYERAIEWHNQTVHPQNSEYVLKKEKYIDIEDAPERVRMITEFLNRFDQRDYFITDLLIYMEGEMYKYLPKKEFLFKWKNKDTTIMEKLIEHNYFTIEKLEPTLLQEKNPTLIFPIFIPIRKMLFFGEFGYKSSLIEYGKLLQRIAGFFDEQNIAYTMIELFENHKLDDLFGLDGVERSIQAFFVAK